MSLSRGGTMGRFSLPALAAAVAAGTGGAPRVQPTKRYYDPGTSPAPRRPFFARPVRRNAKAHDRRAVEATYLPPHTDRWSGRQWRKFRKARQRGDTSDFRRRP